MSAIVDAVRREHRERYGREPRIAIAPGRVNLIGEHTDYNDGFVLPAAIDRFCALAFAPNDEGILRGYSLVEAEERSLAIAALAPPERRSWFDYAAGVLWAHRRESAGSEIPGMDFVVGGDVPIGAGLSSSAAFELAVARAAVELASASWDGREEARLARKAENEYVGVPCGIMDPMACSMARESSAMLLDCRSLDVDWVPIPEDLLIAVLDTGTRRTLAASAYEERRRSCEEAASALGLDALRDASRALLERARESGRMSSIAHRRALHVVTENERTIEMADALRASEHERMGRLMKASHESLRDLFEVSSPALDAIVEIAWRHPAAVGARMTGAGFGGSAVALVASEAAAAESFARGVEASYRARTGLSGTVLLCRAVGGARILG